MCKPQVASDLRFPRTTRPGNRSTTPLPAGASAACGVCCWRCCVSKCAQGRKAGQAQRSHHRLPISQDRLKRGQRGYDAGKRVKGRKRHIASDTMGLLLAVVAPLAGIQDRVGAKALLIRLFMYFWCLKISQLGKQYKDYEISVASAEAFVKIACIRHMQASGMALRTVFKRQTSHCGSYPRLAPRRGIES